MLTHVATAIHLCVWYLRLACSIILTTIAVQVLVAVQRLFWLGLTLEKLEPATHKSDHGFRSGERYIAMADVHFYACIQIQRTSKVKKYHCISPSESYDPTVSIGKYLPIYMF